MFDIISTHSYTHAHMHTPTCPHALDTNSTIPYPSPCFQSSILFPPLLEHATLRGAAGDERSRTWFTHRQNRIIHSILHSTLWMPAGPESRSHHITPYCQSH